LVGTVATPQLVAADRWSARLLWLPTQLLHGPRNRDTVSAMSIHLATAVNNTNRNNLRTNNRARPMRDCALGR